MNAPSETPDANAFRAVFEANYDAVVRFVQRRAAAAQVEDVVADTFLVAWRRFADLPAEPGETRPWLFAVARRTLANAHRGRRRAHALAVRIAHQPEQPDDGDPAAAVHRLDLARAFAQLRPRDQEALVLVVWDGLTPAEAARVLDISTSAFSVRLSRARQRLRDQLDQGSKEGEGS